LAVDYSQIELRLLAHCSEDALLLASFQQNEDIHTRTATEVFRVFPEAVTAELRRQAKAINFGIIYGMSAYGLAKQLNIGQKMAQTYIDHYFERYQGVKGYIETTIEQARNSRQTSTLMGRIRHLPEINSANRNTRQFAERTAINTPIQGSAADLLKASMIKTHQALAQRKLQTRMLLTVHDELVFEVPAQELEIAQPLIESTMETVWELKVPLKVNAAHGRNWADAHA
jgi:DNA polymerase-1